MSAFLFGIFLQWKMNLRNKELFVVYYVVPLVFFLFMGAVFTSIMPDAYKTLIQSMTIFGVTMGGVLGSPSALTEIYHTEVKKSYVVGKIPLWTAAAANFLSGFLHLFIMSMIIYVLAPLLYDAVPPEHAGVYFLSLTLLITVSMAIGTLYGLFIKSSTQMTMMTQFVFLPSVMLSGVMFPADLLPSFLGAISKVFPATWVCTAMQATQFPTTAIIVLCTMLVVFLGLAIWKCKRIAHE